jgi:endo-1,4-beta-D-glucanase Y
MLKKIVVAALCVFAFSCSTNEPTNGGSPQSSDSKGNGNSSPSGSNLGSHLSLPSANKSQMEDRYGKWIAKYYVTYEEEEASITEAQKKKSPPTPEGTARIKWSKPAETVSEGIGYGMLLTALNGDKDRFDKLWKYSQVYRIPTDNLNLMRWHVYGFTKDFDGGSASDADIDILASLMIMYMKTEEKAYLDDAIAIGKSIWDEQLGTNQNNNMLLLPARKSENWGVGADKRPVTSTINVSYISLAAIKLLSIYDTERDWNSVLEANIAYMQKVQNGGDGLWPDWSDLDGAPVDPKNNSCDNITASDASKSLSCLVYNKESVRIPWRITWYYHWFGDARAKDMADKAHAFVAGKTSSNPNNIKSWYGYNDGKEPTVTGGASMWSSLCATGLASSANSGWNETCNQKFLSNDIQSTGYTAYYSESLYMLYLMLFNGGFEL